MSQFIGPIRIRGDYDIEGLENRCGTIQNMVPCKLVRLTKKTDEPGFNAGLFEEVAIGSTPDKPKFIEVDDPQSIPGVIAEQMLAGRKLIFDSTIFVLTAERRVLGFR